jgi:hypothetical protein
MPNYHPQRRRLRLPQLNKANRRARQHGRRSEFVVMCESIAYREELRREQIARARHEAEARRAMAA